MIEAARVSTKVNAPADRVWKALTDPTQLKAYFFGADIATDWQVGSPITFSGQWEGKSFRDKGEIEQVIPGQKLSFTHWSEMSGQPDRPENYHLVTFELAGAGPATAVTLTQDNRSGDVPPDQREAFEKNWQGVLDGLKKTVEG